MTTTQTDPAFPDRMSDSDALLWHIEQDPLLRSTITVVATLDRAPAWADLRLRLVQAADMVPRLRQCVRPQPMDFGCPRWEADPDFDLDYHLRRVALPAGGDLADVLALASAWAMAGFDRSRPLWEFTLIEGLAGGAAAFVLKIHHSLTDGVGGIRLAMELLDPVAAGSSDESPVPSAPDGGQAVVVPRRSLPNPAAELTSAVRLLAPTREPLSPVMRGRSLSWRFRAFDVPLPALRDAAHAAHASVNDAFLAAVTGGLCQYHVELGAPVRELRMTMPISIRGELDPVAAGNRFVPVRFAVPVDIADVRTRMRVLGRLVRRWRAEPSLARAELLAALLNRMPGPAVTGLFGGMLKNVDFVSTNVAGLPAGMRLVGSELVRQYAFAPLSGAAVNIAFLSHGETGCIGVNTDAVAVPDPDLLASCLEQGFAEVLASVPVGVP